MRALHHLIIVLLIGMTATSYAILGGNKIDINSDELVIDKEQMRSSFKGNVVVYFDEYKLTTSELIVHYSKQQNIKSIIIPTPLKLIKKCGSEIVIADKAIYEPASNELSLIGNVLVNKDEHILKTQKVIYYTKLKTKLTDAK
ncbi:MAG: hypothetical protein DGJ47_001105 [Rickettsiaceae bacterium]